MPSLASIKKNFEKLSLSHILIFCAGIMLPIISDVLFLHGFDASTLSAIWDTITGIMAIIATFTVVSWMKDKVDNRAFKQAEEIIDGYANLNIDKTFLLLEATNLIKINYNHNRIFPTKTQKHKFNEFNESLDKVYKNHLFMRSKYTGLRTWGIRPKDHQYFVNLRQNYDFFFEAMRGISATEDEPNMVTRDMNYHINSNKMRSFYRGITKLSDKLSEPFENIFEKYN